MSMESAGYWENEEKVKDELLSLSLADHTGDVNSSLPRLARALGLPEPRWSTRWERMVWPWEDDRWGDRDREEDE